MKAELLLRSIEWKRFHLRNRIREAQNKLTAYDEVERDLILPTARQELISALASRSSAAAAKQGNTP